MSLDLARVRATPFHNRAAEANDGNEWTVRNGYTLARCYAGTEEEALAVRFRAGLIDVSWYQRLLIEGARAGAFLVHLLTRDVTKIAIGMSVRALWLSDGGGVRGACTVARVDKERFLLVLPLPDYDWIVAAANRFDVSVRDVSSGAGGLSVVGPYAAAALGRAGLAVDLAPYRFRKQRWRGVDVRFSRWNGTGGYEIWCKEDDGLLVWDRLMRAGAVFGLEPVGIAASDICDMEAGVLCAGRDYVPARDGYAAAPSPRALALDALIDDTHSGFNGHAAYLAARDGVTRRLVGLTFDSDTPASHSPLRRNGAVIGHTLTSIYSPVLRRAIAFANIEADMAVAGTELLVTLAPDPGTSEFRTAAARVSKLPFLSPSRVVTLAASEN